jgi:hypothetical protein
MVATAGVEKKHRNLLFIEDFIELSCPASTVKARFANDGEWLAPLANAAEAEGEVFRLRVGPQWAGGRLTTREVRTTILGHREREDALVVTIAWQVTSHPSLFPVLTGDLELANVASGMCRLTLSASYVPPLGELGIALDRALMHRIAQSTIRAFLEGLAKSLEDLDAAEP